jgi:hypothetical protein
MMILNVPVEANDCVPFYFLRICQPAMALDIRAAGVYRPWHIRDLSPHESVIIGFTRTYGDVSLTFR